MVKSILLNVLTSLALVHCAPVEQVRLSTNTNEVTVTVEKSSFTVTEQSEDICRAGSKQWTGMVDVSPTNSLFYWFFESRNDPQNDPVVVWINGGPGGSSLFGLFREIGPCLVNNFGNDTIFNAASWSNYANILFIDQPAGVGFSNVNGSTEGGPTTLHEAAIDFERFLSIFFTEAFPQFSHQPFHLTGESFAGHYIPAFTKYISERQKMQAKGYFKMPIESIVLVDAVIDTVTSSVGGLYDHFCSRDNDGNLNKPHGFNETACAAIEKATPACEHINKQCIESYDPNICRYAVEYCEENIGKWFLGDVVVGGRDPYDDRKLCETNPPMCEDFLNGTVSRYLNEERIYKALGIAENFTYIGVNMDLNSRWCEGDDCFIPTTRETTYILEEMDTRVLVINGNNDSIVSTEGNIRVYEQLPWSKQALFRVKHFVDWFWPNGKPGGMKGGQVKSAGKLSFVTVDEAGHTSPGDEPEAVAFIMDCWVNGADKKERNCPI